MTPKMEREKGGKRNAKGADKGGNCRVCRMIVQILTDNSLLHTRIRAGGRRRRQSAKRTDVNCNRRISYYLPAKRKRIEESRTSRNDRNEGMNNK